MLLTYALCIAFGSIGNAVTLMTMASTDRKNKSATNVFLISLSVSSLEVIIGCINVMLLINISRAVPILVVH